MQCGIQEVLRKYDDREEGQVTPEEADKIVSFLGKDDREALKRAWAGEASDEWRDLVTEAKTLLGLKKWNEEARPSERPTKKLRPPPPPK